MDRSSHVGARLEGRHRIVDRHPLHHPAPGVARYRRVAQHVARAAARRPRNLHHRHRVLLDLEGKGARDLLVPLSDRRGDGYRPGAQHRHESPLVDGGQTPAVARPPDLDAPPHASVPREGTGFEPDQRTRKELHARIDDLDLHDRGADHRDRRGEGADLGRSRAACRRRLNRHAQLGLPFRNPHDVSFPQRREAGIDVGQDPDPGNRRARRVVCDQLHILAHREGVADFDDDLGRLGAYLRHPRPDLDGRNVSPRQRRSFGGLGGGVRWRSFRLGRGGGGGRVGLGRPLRVDGRVRADPAGEEEARWRAR